MKCGIYLSSLCDVDIFTIRFNLVLKSVQFIGALKKCNPLLHSEIIQSMTVIKWQGVNCFMHFVSEQWLENGIGGMHSARNLIRVYLQTQRKDLRWRLCLVCQRWSCQWKSGNCLMSVWIQSGRSGLLWFGVSVYRFTVIQQWAVIMKPKVMASSSFLIKKGNYYWTVALQF